MLVREEVVFAAHVGHLQESQALSSERLGSPALYFPVQSDPLEKGYRLCARACLITADLYTTIGMVSPLYSTWFKSPLSEERSHQNSLPSLHSSQVTTSYYHAILSRGFSEECSEGNRRFCRCLPAAIKLYILLRQITSNLLWL